MSSEFAGKGVRRLKIGKYQVMTHVATGGMGAVYKAVDVETGREVALKVLSPELAANPVMLTRFRREAGHATKVNHENIVRLYEWGESKGFYFLALEFVDGIDLHEYVKNKGQLDVDESRQIVIQAARALAHLHKLGIVHRDIKPSNFLVSQNDGRPFIKLIDLGLARETNDEEFRLTRASHTLGTIDYMSPEQARDSGSADIRSDIYSLGCTWFHLLTGNPPFPKGSLTERIYQHSEVEPPDIRQLNPNVPQAIVHILQQILAKDPADRYPTPAALLRDLEQLDHLPAHSDHELLAGLATGKVSKPRSDPQAQVRRPRNHPKTRFRDAEKPEEEKAVKTQAGFASGLRRWLWAMIGGSVLAAVVVVVYLVGLRSHTDSVSVQGAVETPAIASATGPGKPRPKPPPEPRQTGSVSPPKPAPLPYVPNSAPKKPALARLYQPSLAIDASRLRQEFEQPWQGTLAAEEPVLLFRVSRIDKGGQGRYFESLTAACAALPANQQTVIEIDDNGPLFEPPAAVKGRSLVIKAGKGYRPLVAWDAQHPPSGIGDTFLSVEQGSLTLEGVDVVCQCADSGQTKRSTLFAVADGAFSAKSCTFSVAGKHRLGVAVVRLASTAPTSAGQCKCRLDQCYVRGAEVVALDLRAASAEVLLNSCLVVGGKRPLIDVTGLNDSSDMAIRVMRSTLVAGHTLLHVRGDGGAAISTPVLQWTCWDSLLARSGEQVGGEMVSVTDGTHTGALRWRAVNCLYTGWNTLLAGPHQRLAHLNDWHALFGYREGDAVREASWPAIVHLEPALISAHEYNPAGTAVAFAASAGPGLLGCDLLALPAARDNWLELTYRRFVTAALDLPATDAVPIIPTSRDGLYRGERLNLDRIDLGAYLHALQKTKTFWPKVVLWLSGSGQRSTSPIHVKGSSLVLYFEPTEGSTDNPLTLVPDSNTALGHDALIEVEDGNLELIGGTIKFSDSKVAPLPRHMLQVQGGHLLVSGCRLQGPLAQQPVSYRGLIAFQGSGQLAPERAHGCSLTQTVLISTKNCLEIAGAGSQLRLENCVVVAGTDAFHLAPRPARGYQLNMQCILEHNTIAAKRAVIDLADAPTLGVPAVPVIVQAIANVFMDPFTETPHQGGLLLCEGDAFGHGLLLWQGADNVYDQKRLHFYAEPIEGPLADKAQAYATWKRLWGSAGDVKPLLYLSWPRTFRLDDPKLAFLALPPLRPPRPKPLPGADLARLGIVKTGKK